MTEELKEQIERLHDDLQYMEWLDMAAVAEGGEKQFAVAYKLQESPFAECEPENQRRIIRNEAEKEKNE